jgi:hypothetical protein
MGSRLRFADVEALNGATGVSDPAAAGPRGSGEGDGNRPNTIVKALKRCSGTKEYFEEVQKAEVKVSF